MSRTAVPDTHEMVIIHRVFRREFRLLHDLIWRVVGRRTYDGYVRMIRRSS
ncbi:hypothetical protein OHA70_35055 [Kribbella sp. NBC_00382]|uniref:hypothetical protein n=1 Tax=Kribbella sp. NBC_00382 TaxID=2975967 RepID=UPI002E1FE8BB